VFNARTKVRDAQAALSAARKARDQASATYKASKSASDAAAKLATDASNDAKVAQSAADDAKKAADAAEAARKAFQNGEVNAADTGFTPFSSQKDAKDAEIKTTQAAYTTISGYPAELQPALKQKLDTKMNDLNQWKKKYEDAKTRRHHAHNQHKTLKDTSTSKGNVADAAAKNFAAKKSHADSASSKANQAALVASNSKKSLDDSEAKVKTTRAAYREALKGLGRALKARSKAYLLALDTVKTQENASIKVVSEAEATLAKLQSQRDEIKRKLKAARDKKHRQEKKLAKLQGDKSSAEKDEQKKKNTLEQALSHRKHAQDDFNGFKAQNPDVVTKDK